MAKKKGLSASLEDYLEAIYLSRDGDGEARAKEITKRVGVSGASVTEACYLLRDKGLVNYSPYSAITLTNEGENHARDIILRHETLKDFFIEVLKVDPQTADEGACRMEHVVSPKIVERMIKYTRYLRLKNNQEDSDEWPGFNEFLLGKNNSPR